MWCESLFCRWTGEAFLSMVKPRAPVSFGQPPGQSPAKLQAASAFRWRSAQLWVCVCGCLRWPFPAWICHTQDISCPISPPRPEGSGKLTTPPGDPHLQCLGSTLQLSFSRAGAKPALPQCLAGRQAFCLEHFSAAGEDPLQQTGRDATPLAQL